MIAHEKNFDIFVHYDTDVIPAEDNGIIKLRFPKDGFYYMTLHSISLKFPDGYTPDQYNGFLRMCSLKESQKGIIKIGGLDGKYNFVYFPLYKPSDPNPKCKIYNKFQLHVDDSINLTYRDKFGKYVPMDRIVATVHITNNIKLLYVD